MTTPRLEAPIGMWMALDPVTPEQVEEDRAQLPPRPSKYAHNIVLNIVLRSGRSWRWVAVSDSGRPQTPKELL